MKRRARPIYHAIAIAALALGASRAATAHMAGTSESTFTLDPRTRAVDMKLVLARDDAAKLARGGELGDAMKDLVASAVEVRGDGATCAARFVGLDELGEDVVLHASFACAHVSSRLGVQLLFLDELGPRHLHATHIDARDASTDTALRSGAQTVDLALGAPWRWEKDGLGLACGVLGAAVALVVVVRRLRSISDRRD